MAPQIKRIPVGAIDVTHGRWHVRIHWPRSSLARLKRSMLEEGQREPIVVRPAGSGFQYQLVAGRRRLEAARALGWHRVCAELVAGTDAEMASRALAHEFAGREQMTYLERGWVAVTAQTLREKEGMPSSTRQMAAEFELKKSSVNNALRLGRGFPATTVERVATDAGTTLENVITISQASLLAILAAQDGCAEREALLAVAVQAHISKKSAKAAVHEALGDGRQQPSVHRLTSTSRVHPRLRMDRPVSQLPADQAAALAEDLEAMAAEARRHAEQRPTGVQRVQRLDIRRRFRAMVQGLVGFVRWVLRRWSR